MLHFIKDLLALLIGPMEVTGLLTRLWPVASVQTFFEPAKALVVVEGAEGDFFLTDLNWDAKVRAAVTLEEEARCVRLVAGQDLETLTCKGDLHVVAVLLDRAVAQGMIEGLTLW